MIIKNNILVANNLQIGYDNKSISSAINIQLKQGTLTALIGVNGIGKSTFLRTISGLQKPIAGSIYINEKKLQLIENTQLAQLQSLVLTDTLVASNLTVYDIIALGRQPYTNWLGKLSKNDYLIIENAIKETNIDYLRYKKHNQISDGQLQTVMIARALAQNTPLIYLDEPTTHLDLLHKASILKLLKKLAQSGKSILYSTHDINLALQLADEMIVFTSQNVMQNTPKELIKSGVFETLFDDKLIKFDSKKELFVIN